MVEKKSLLTRLSQYLREVRRELKKVTWPSKQEIVASTIVVLIVVIFFALFIGGLDFFFAQVLRLGLVKFFGG
ncbi:MAG: preprotein translocase subunit SecE [Actinomycetota bacterium]|nr:preprotein translocase subunit SecE [Actinomycetota bacterium]